MKTLVTPINRGWMFREDFDEAYLDFSCPAIGFRPVALPHTTKEVPFNYFDEKDYQFISTYRRVLSVTAEQLKNRLFVDFEGVMVACDVYLNGELVASHLGGFTPFSAEITDVAHEGENLLVVRVDSTERPDIPPFGGTVDYICYGGIYREVALREEPRAFISNVFARPNVAEKNLSVTVRVDDATGLGGEERLAFVLCREGVTVARAEGVLTVEDRGEYRLVSEKIENLALWDIDNPALYDLTVELTCGGDISQKTARVGFRDARLTADGFFLNGKRVKLMGLDRHQQFPYVGYAMPARVQARDADIMRNEFGLNCVRTSHYPQSRHFLDRCDEVGLLVLEEIPGWQHIGDENWKKISCDNVREMIERDFNHPSIFLWGVRINESQDDHDFYTETNRIAHEIDDTRPTGGIRAICNSEFLEDVYTMNDFIHDGGKVALRDPKEITGLDEYTPYIVTEYCGHTYPTKRYDNEERLQEHALRHARVQNQAHSEPHSAGAIGWCAFDYNTHRDFGSGDRICYHGVADMFRIAKPAAGVYASQISPDVRPVLVPDSYWAIGEKSGGGMKTVVVYTNCDCVKVFVGDCEVGQWAPDQEHFAGLDHAPVVMDLSELALWGDAWGDARFEGFLNGKKVIEKNFSGNPLPKKLLVEPDDRRLCAGDWDATRVVVRLVDEFENTLPYAFEPAELSVEGEGTIIGPGSVSLLGGCIAFWVKTTGNPGTVRVSATARGITTQAEITVK